VWNKTLDKITPAVWKKLAAKVDRLIVADWKSEGGEALSKTDRTDNSKIVFNVDSSSDSENEFEYLDYDDQHDEEVKKALRTTDAPHRVLLDRKVASTGEPPARRALLLDTEKVNVSAHTRAIGRRPFFH